ncbi:MAG: tetraacyldisaccharide 4'-kinase [candidate division Zixibacteria bacterium]|nr:tetraacyldisaccharide 4'-kinase [candidate division Zixibacteria bacterium]
MLEYFWKKILRRKGISLWHIPALVMWVLSLLFWPISVFHRGRKRDQLKLSLPVISVGNITVGGSGKTPLVELIASELLNDNIRVGIVSSGYKRLTTDSFIAPGYKVQTMDVDQTGDEIMLLAHLVPNAVFSVASRKSEAALKLADSNLVDVIVVDDGFQHQSLARDIDIVTFDAAVARRKLRMFPYGVLREPLSALKHAEVIIITRANVAKDITGLQRRLKKEINPSAEYFSAHFKSDELIGRSQTMPVKYLDDKAVFLFAGVGSFAALQKQVVSLSGNLVGYYEFSDHQIYTPSILEKIKKQAEKRKAEVIVTTGKDWVKLGGFDFGREIYFLNLVLDLNPSEEHLTRFLKSQLQLGSLKGPERY